MPGEAASSKGIGKFQEAEAEPLSRTAEARCGLTNTRQTVSQIPIFADFGAAGMAGSVSQLSPKLENLARTQRHRPTPSQLCCGAPLGSHLSFPPPI